MRTSALVLEDFLKEEENAFLAMENEIEEGEEIDVEAIESAAFERGREEGLAEAISVKTAEVEASLQEALQQISSDITIVEEKIAAETLGYLQTIFSSLLPRFAGAGIALETSDRITDFLNDKTRAGSAAPRINARVSPEVIDQLNGHIEAAGADDNVLCHPDDTMPATQISLEWRDGGAEIDAQAIIDDILESLNRAISTLSERTA
ncbi:MAG: hypothetical protein EVA70_03035 [Parvularculaceae bacterium]|nr:MAG: hypothetical protein EVA70_03035 [Parvularculaceae bacterium]